MEQGAWSDLRYRHSQSKRPENVSRLQRRSREGDTDVGGGYGDASR